MQSTQTEYRSSRAVTAISALAMCAMLLAPGPAKAVGYGPNEYFADIDKALKEYNATEESARQPGGSTRNFVQAGVTLSNLACEIWLTELGLADRNTGFIKDIMNVVGNLILGVAGINGARSSSLARGTLGLSAGNAAIDVFRSDIILGTIDDIKGKLREGRSVGERTLMANIPDNLSEARRRLLDYNTTCSSEAIKSLLKAGLAAVRYQPVDTSLSVVTERLRADSLALDLYKAVFGSAGVFSNDTLYKLYVTVIAVPTGGTDLVQKYRNDTYVQSVAAASSGAISNAVNKNLLQQIADLQDFQSRLMTDLRNEANEKAKTDLMQAQSDLATKKKTLDDGLKAVTADTAAAADASMFKAIVDKLAAASIAEGSALASILDQVVSLGTSLTTNVATTTTVKTALGSYISSARAFLAAQGRLQSLQVAVPGRTVSIIPQIVPSNR